VGGVVNLRQARKAKERASRQQTAAEHRRAFGRTKAEKLAEAAEKDRAAREIAAHRRDDDTP
jgi:hypothetical protein